MNIFKSLFEIKPRVGFDKGTWLKIKDERYQEAYLGLRETPLFIKLTKDVYSTKSEACYVHTANISVGELSASENGDHLYYSRILDSYELISDISTVELLECLLSNEIKRSTDARESARNERIVSIQKKTADAIAKTKCVRSES